MACGHVDNHLHDCGNFEGTIPKGEYGAGTVIIRDRGTWSPAFDPKIGCAKANQEFVLAGEKLMGRWHLVGRQGKPREKRESLLLIKGDDATARVFADVLPDAPLAAKTGRDCPRSHRKCRDGHRKPHKSMCQRRWCPQVANPLRRRISWPPHWPFWWPCRCPRNHMGRFGCIKSSSTATHFKR